MDPDDINLPAQNPTAPPDEDELSDEAIEQLLAAGAGPRRERRGDWIPPSAEEVHRLLPDYEVQSLIGRGGMGAVYRGVQRSLDRPVAIKILTPEIAGSDAQFAARFKQEARAMAKLPHPHIIAVYDFGETAGGLFYIIMELVDGTDLSQIMRSEGHLPPRRAAAIISQVCDALEFAHEHGIVHRDIKPSNVMLDQRGRVKVADFGLAKELAREEAVTLSGAVMGTRAYMSPEQAQGRTVDHRADIYSVGVMFYEMLTGEPPHGAIEPPSRKIELDVRLDSVVLKALAQDPGRRYQRASEVKTEVDRITENKSAGEGASKQSDSGRWMWMLAAFAVAALVVVVALLVRVPLTPRGDVSRECAELALARGARVLVREANGRESDVSPGGVLPAAAFKLTAIRFETPSPNVPILSSAEIQKMVRAPELEVLSYFHSNPQLGDAVFAAFGALPRLRELNFNNPGMEDDWLRHLASSSMLTLLRIPGSYITDSGLAHLAGIVTIDDLDVNKTNVTGRGIASLASAPTMRGLSFGNQARQLTQDDIAAVADHCSNLEKLVISGPIAPENLHPLTRLKKLRLFIFGSSQALSAGHFRAMVGTSIGHIAIIRAVVADDAWDALAALTQVDTVQFTNMRWPDAAVPALSRMASLRTVVLADGPSSDVLRAQAALPNAIVTKVGTDKNVSEAPRAP